MYNYYSELKYDSLNVFYICHNSDAIEEYDHKLRIWAEMQRENQDQHRKIDFIEAMVKELNYKYVSIE